MKAAATAAANERVTANLRLIGVALRPFTTYSRASPMLSTEDLWNCAAEALVRAARSYDPARGAFSTWAVLKMRGALYDEVRDRGPTSRSEYRRGLRRSVSSLDALLEAGVMPALRDPSDLDAPEAAALAREQHEELRRALATLPERERRIVLHQGQAGDLVRAFGVSQSRIQQLRTRAYRKLRAALGDRGEYNAGARRRSGVCQSAQRQSGPSRVSFADAKREGERIRP